MNGISDEDKRKKTKEEIKELLDKVEKMDSENKDYFDFVRYIYTGVNKIINNAKER